MRTPAPLPTEPPPISDPVWEKTYPGLPSQAGQVRAALRPLLRDCPVADDVLLVASELAANAIAHSHSGRAGGTFTIRLHHSPGVYVHAEVQDLGSIWDGDLAASARHLHGLSLIAALSSRCGTRAGPGGSRLVWARIDYPAPGGTAA